jgi:fibro-slime domain-containing protein
VPVQYYAQMPDECVNLYDATAHDRLVERQFEWAKCGYYWGGVDLGMVSGLLGEDGVPVADLGGEMLSSLGVTTDGFRRWFGEEEGKSIARAGVLGLKHNADLRTYAFESEDFYPLEGFAPFGGHGSERLFTMSASLPLVVVSNGKGLMSLTADDDTWVFADEELVLDMGGVHGPVDAQLMIDETGEIYAAVGEEELAYSGVRIDSGKLNLKIFHANRNSGESVFALNIKNMMLDMVSVELARNEQDGVAIAYGGEATHIAPLGRSVSKGPVRTRSLASAIVIQAFSVGAFSILMAVVIFAARRYWHPGRSPVK